jgi:hypothetical protein
VDAAQRATGYNQGMVRLTTAEFRCYRIFDVADELDLERCRSIIKGGGVESTRLSLKREGSEYVQLSNPPLHVELGPRTLVVLGQPVAVQLGARLFHHGAISVTVRVPVERGTSLEHLVPFADELYDSRAIDALCLAEVDKLRASLLPSFTAPHLWEQNEAYTVLLVRELEGRPAAEALLAEPHLARLIIGESREPALSSSETREVLEHAWSYTPHDLAIIEWNAAFLYEPTGSDDLVDLLDIANAQLLELRYYDAVLDAELDRVYDIIGAKKVGSLLFSPYKNLLRELMLTLIELSEFIERIENALKIVGDVYLARVYEGAVAQLRIRQWTEQVSRKHRLLQQTYGLLKGEVDTSRALTLEMMVVALILFEVVMALVKVTGH